MPYGSITKKIIQQYIWICSLLFAATSVLVVSIKFNNPGMGDVDSYYLQWIREMQSLGTINAYKQDGGFDQYPPGVVLLANLVHQISNQSLLNSWKIAGTINLAFLAIVIYYFTKSRTLSAFSFLAMSYPTLGGGYADIHFMPWLTISLFLLVKERFFFAGLMFGFSCFFKWQPIIYLPALILYFLFKRNFSALKRFIAAGGIIVLSLISIYGWYNPAKSIWLSLLNHYFSAWGPNLYWILTWLLSTYFTNHLADLGIWGGGPGLDGSFSSLKGDPKSGMFALFKTLFSVLYLVNAYLYVKNKKYLSINLIRLLVSTAIIYWQFSTGVHANHILILLPPMIVLCYLEKRYLPWLICIFFVILTNLNIFVGIDGIGNLSLPRYLFSLDVSIFISALAFCTSLLFIYYLGRDAVKDRKL